MTSHLDLFKNNNSERLPPSKPADEPHLLLLPTKVYPLSLDDLEDDDEFSSLVFQAFPNSLVQWTAQPVVRWVEGLAAAAENAELEEIAETATVGSDYLSSIEIGGVKLSQRSSAESLRRGFHAHCPASPMPTTTLTHNPKDFDTAFILEQDSQAWTYVQNMNQLANAIESSLMACRGKGTTNRDTTFYKTIHSRLEFTFGRIVLQFPYEASTEDAGMRLLLNSLYENTIRKLQGLLDSLVLGTERVHSPRPHALVCKEPVPPVVTPTPSVGKKDLGSFMTQWLLDNWTNPYPDDDGMVQLAQECGVTATVVSNWLINARTRKWRPAIVKATELDRPSCQLLEDSICIFRGIPLRVLDVDRPKKRAKTSA